MRKSIKKALKITEKCIQWFILAILIIFIGINLYMNISVSMGNPVPTVFGVSYLNVGGGSMEPEIKKGSLVIVKKQKSYAVGDVVTYVLPNEKTPVTHKIMSIDGSSITTQGVSAYNNTPDPAFDVSLIRGKVTSYYAGVGSFLEWLKSAYGIITIVALGGIILIAPSIIRGIFAKDDDEN